MIRFEFRTADVTMHSRGAVRPRFADVLSLLIEEGAGKVGHRLAPAVRAQKTHTVWTTGEAEIARPSLREWF